MKTIAAVFFLSVAFFAFSNAAKYSGRLDNIDLDEILRSDRLLKNYFECLMERGPCTAEGADLRKAIPDALQTDCTKCSQSQKKKAAKAIDFLRDNKEEMYEELVKKYDPEGKYKERIEKNLDLKSKSGK